jgi:CHAT domain-containing protein
MVPSAAIAVHLWHRTSPGGDATVLAYGDPDFGSSLATGDWSGGSDPWRSAAGGGLKRLAQSGHEARRVARFGHSAKVRVGRQATEASLKRESMNQYRVLHFATHALVDEVAVNRAGLVLTPGDGEDGFVTASELSELSLMADLVVLSACRTAGGVVVDGEGMQGLTAPLLEAGARSIVATHWPIGDKATVAAMDTFYGAMARGLPVGAALREMKLALISQGAAINEWASFAVIGDPLASPPLRVPAPPYGYLAGGLMLLSLMGYFGWKRTRHGTARS